MLEALLAATATSGLFALARGQRRSVSTEDRISGDVIVMNDDGEDLPCPWCYGQTAGTDTRCGSCGRNFG